MSQEGSKSHSRPPTSFAQNRQHDATSSALKTAILDQTPLNYGSQSAGTTTDASSTSNVIRPPNRPIGIEGDANQSRDVQDTMSLVSQFSYRSDLDASRFLREVQGRLFNSVNETYFLPLMTASSLVCTMNKQHIAFVLALGELYPAADVVDAVLTAREGERKRILDLGCGTGVWAMDMAKKFPHVEVLGIDLAPVPVEPENLLPNCRFEIDDITLGLQHCWGKYDLVHARFIASGIKDSRKTMKDIHNCVSNGGIMIWLEADYDVVSTDIYAYRPLATETNPTGSWTGRLIYEIIRAGTRLGNSDFAGMANAIDAGLWNNPIFDPETCKAASVYLPLGPWAKHEDMNISHRLKYIGVLMRQVIHDVHIGARVLLERAGWPADTIAQWQRLADEEMETMKTPIQLRFRSAWGRRRAENNKPASPLPPLIADENLDDQSPLSEPYPFFLCLSHSRGSASGERASTTK